MTPEDKAHLTPVLSPLPLLCHLKLKRCRRAVSFFASRRPPSPPPQRSYDADGKTNKLGDVRQSSVCGGAAGCRIGCGLKCFSGQLIGLI